MKKSKLALFQSVIALILCISMLMGTTFAWFTDSVTSENNIIVSGKLDAGLYWTDDVTPAEGEIQWNDAEKGTIFDYPLWEPGFSQMKYVKITNEGNLAFRYRLQVLPNVPAEAGEADLAEVIDVYFGIVDENFTEPVYFSAEMAGMTRLGTLAEVMNHADGAASGALLPENGTGTLPDGVTAPVGEVTACILLHMQESAGNEYQNLDVGGGFRVMLLATQFTYENDSFGNDYDSDAGFSFPDGFISAEISGDVNVTDNKVAEDVTLDGGLVSAQVPAGVQVSEGTDKLTLSVSEKEETESNLTLGANEELRPLDVHVEGVAADNTQPMEIFIGRVAPVGLNKGNLKLYHVENGVSVPMTEVEEFTAHNQFKYNPATGDVTLYMATFSEVTLVADLVNAWNGTVAEGFAGGDGTEDAPYIIANADQLAYLGNVVSNENATYGSAYYKLISDINIGGIGNYNTYGRKVLWYPIGYNKVGGTTTDKGSWYTYGGAFQGTFDGTGHTITGIYQNTWSMVGDYSGTYYNDAMGLFGYVYNGTVKNLTIDNFYSEGEFAPTGCVAAYAAGNATFENIAITNSHPQTYNTGVAGIVGWDNGGDTEDEASNFTFKNITVDSSNTISALWGSWDVAAAGLLGYLGEYSKANLENCNVSATIDVYNDVCGNYQYYWYRYCGMLIGTVDKRLDNGQGALDLSNVTAKNCTVNFGDRHEYYYCEFEKNSQASYTEDFQFSRVPHSELNMVENPVTCKHNHSAKEDKQAVYIPFRQLFGGYGWGVDGVEMEEYNNLDINVEGNDIIEGEENSSVKFNVVPELDASVITESDLEVTISELFAASDGAKINGSAVQVAVTALNESGITAEYVADTSDWTQGTLTFNKTEGLCAVTIQDYNFCKPTTIYLENGKRVELEKFAIVFPNVDKYLYRVGNQNAVALSSLFKETDIAPDDAKVNVSVTKVSGNATGAYTSNTTVWENGTLQFSGTGVVAVTISEDGAYEKILNLEVVDAENITTAKAGTNKKYVLLNDVTFSSTYLYYKNATLYGNGFTLDITGADHSDLKDSSDTNSNKSAYCNIWAVDSRFDNIRIVGSVYPAVGMTADSDYGNAAIRTEGDCYITNSYISNCRVPLRVQGNTTLENTVVDGGRYANIELRKGNLTLDGVTTINTVRKGSDGTTDVIGFGIVIHSEAADASISVIGGGLKQYNWVGENKHKNILSGDANLKSAYKLIFDENNSDRIYFEGNSDRYVNTGILCLSATIEKDVVTGLSDRYYQEVSGYDAWVLTYDNEKHQDWFAESAEKETVAGQPEQEAVLPNYSGDEPQTVEFTKGETYYFDTSVLTAEKIGNTLEISSVVMNGTTYNYGEQIAITEGGVYEIVYTVVDPYNFGADGTTATTVNHTVSIMLTAIAKDAEILAPKFTFIDQNGNEYESTTVKIGDKTYVMPKVTAADPTTNSMSSINIGSASISGTTVYFPIATGYTVRSGSNFNRYYPLFNGINITDYTVAGDTTGTTYTTSGDYTSLVGSSDTKFIIPANGTQTNCGDYVKTDGQAGNAAGNSDSGWQGAGYSTKYSTYLKSGNTNASSGADSNGYERIVWVEYCFNAGNGDVYYYRIGYHCNKESTQSCVTGDTLVTLADGTQKRMDEILETDLVLVFDHETGTYAEMPLLYYVNDGVDEYRVINLEFSDGNTTRLIYEHALFDMTLNRYVYIREDNYAEFVGHRFAKDDGNGGFDDVVLEKAYITEETVGCYSITSMYHLNYYINGMLSLPGAINGLFNYFEYDPDTLQYDQEQMEADIEKYGLYTYEDFAEYLPEEMFDTILPVRYLKIAVGKGMITFEEIREMFFDYLA